MHQNDPHEDFFEGKWKELKGKVKEEWGDLTDDDLTEIAGKREKLAGRLQSRYGWDQPKAESELERFRQKYEH